MSLFLGIDTSNYTTSAAVFDSGGGTVIQEKLLLPVKENERGLRQSDAVFHHTVNLPKVFSALSEKVCLKDISAVGVSFRPRNSEGSYMPCFLCGEGLAGTIGKILDIPVYKTSHQTGHILAALYSSGKLGLLSESFIAFHVSGGTTDCLLCEKDDEEILNISEIGKSLDLKAGQLIDRTGVMLGLEFPCGAELEKLAEKSTERFKIKPVMKNGNCSLSGFENKFAKMHEDGAASEDIALACETAAAETIVKMTEYAAEKYGSLPIVFAGGVMSNKFIKERIAEKFGAFFAQPEFSRDNAAGTAVYAKLKYKTE